VSDYYKGKIRVCSYLTKECFAVDPVTLEPLGTSTHDPWFLQPHGEIEMISMETWWKRKGLCHPDYLENSSG